MIKSIHHQKRMDCMYNNRDNNRTNEFEFDPVASIRKCKIELLQ